jgi:hypothetical protein
MGKKRTFLQAVGGDIHRYLMMIDHPFKKSHLASRAVICWRSGKTGGRAECIRREYQCPEDNLLASHHLISLNRSNFGRLSSGRSASRRRHLAGFHQII